MLPNHHFKHFNGLRGVAILLVMLYHYRIGFPVMQLGWSGVDLFFVLSGYLIAMNYARYSNQENGYLRFLKNRLLRIGPLYFAVLIGFYVFIVVPTDASKQAYFSSYLHNWYEYPLFLQNWGLILHHKLEANHLEHFWSLAVEMQFYLLSPLLIRFLNKFRNVYVLVLIAIGFIAVRFFLSSNMSQWNEYYVYYGNTFCRVDSFLMGMWLFLNRDQLSAKKLTWLFAVGLFLLVMVGWFDESWSMHFPLMAGIGFTGFYLVYGFLVAYPFYHPHSFITRALESRIFQFVGTYSYGLYVFHWLVLRFGMGKTRGFLLPYVGAEFSLILSTSFLLLITFLLSMLSYHLLEAPFLKLKKTN